MNWLTMFKKGALGALTFGAAYLASNPSVLTHLIPSNISQMTVGGVAAAVCVMVANWLKNKTPAA